MKPRRRVAAGGPIEICIAETARSVVVAVSGDIDLTTVDQFDRALTTAVAASTQSVEVDLSRVTYFGADAVRALVAARTYAREEGVDLRVTAATPAVDRVLDITGMSEWLRWPPVIWSAGPLRR